MEHREATETSLLLAKPTTALPDPGLTPNSVPPSETEDAGLQNRGTKPAEDEERQSNDDNRGHQYKGMPDMKAKLLYIVPAVGIGVRLASSSHELTSNML